MTKLTALTGTINGSNMAFVVPEPFVAGTLRVFWNGVLVDPSDATYGYTETETGATLASAPATGDKIEGLYEQLLYDGSPHDPSGVLP